MNGETKKALSIAAVNGRPSPSPPRRSVYRWRSPNVLWTSTIDDPQVAVRVAAQVEARRVEHVAERPQVRHEGHAPARGVLALGPQVRADVGIDVGRGLRPGGRGRGTRAAARRLRPNSRSRPIEVVELGEVERGVPDVVLEPVRERPGAAVANLALEEVRPHAAASPSASRIIVGRLEARPAAVLVEPVAEMRAGEPGAVAALEAAERRPGHRACGTCTWGG